MPPRMNEAPLAEFPPLPEDPKDFAQWAQSLAELSEQRGEARGTQKGRKEGLQEGRAADVLMVLRTRGVPVPPEVERRIASCTDAELLSSWLQRAITATAADEIFLSS
jgi:predicted transposase YdaD